MNTIFPSVILATLLFSSAALVAGERPTLTRPPTDQLVALSSTASFTVGATGEEPMFYQWRFNGTNLYATYGLHSGGATTNLQVFAAGADSVGEYTVTVTNAFGAVTSQVARLDIRTVPGLVGLHAGATNPITEGWRGGSGTGISLTLGPTNDSGTLAWAVYDPSDEINTWGSYVIFPTTNLVNLALTRGWSMRSTLRLLGANPSGYANTIMIGFNTGNWYHRLDINTDSGGNATVQVLGGGFITIPGTDYHTYELRYLPGDAPRLYVDGELKLTGCQGEAFIYQPRLFFGAGRSAGVGFAHFANVEMEFFGPPQIVQLPLNRTNVVGDHTAFSVTATSHWPLTYQWFRDGVPLGEGSQVSGATTNRLSLLNLTLNTAGDYHVRISDGQVFTNSPAARLVVYPSADSTLRAPDCAAGLFQFSVSAPTGLRYGVLSSSDLINWTWLHTNCAPFQFSTTPAADPPRQFFRTVYLP